MTHNPILKNASTFIKTSYEMKSHIWMLWPESIFLIFFHESKTSCWYKLNTTNNDKTWTQDKNTNIYSNKHYFNKSIYLTPVKFVTTLTLTVQNIYVLFQDNQIFPRHLCYDNFVFYIRYLLKLVWISLF